MVLTFPLRNAIVITELRNRLTIAARRYSLSRTALHFDSAPPASTQLTRLRSTLKDCTKHLQPWSKSQCPFVPIPFN